MPFFLVAHRLHKTGPSVMIVSTTIMIAILGFYFAYKRPSAIEWAHRAPMKSISITADTSLIDFEIALKKHPSAAGFERLASLDFDQQDYINAADALQEAIRLGGGSSNLYSELGQMTTLAHGGGVVPAAVSEFGMALRYDPSEARALYFLGLHAYQQNDKKEAISIWKYLISQGSGKEIWFSLVDKHIQDTTKEAHLDLATIPAVSPNLDSMGIPSLSKEISRQLQNNTKSEALIDQAQNSQKQLIGLMIKGLLTKLTVSPNDADGWRRLKRAYEAIGDKDKADDAERHILVLQNPQPASNAP